MRLPISSAFDQGLREDVPVGAIPIGAAEIARNVEFNSTTGPRTRPGYTRLTTQQPDPTALRLDGNHACVVIDPSETGGSNLELDNNWLLVMGFSLRTPEPGATNPGSFLWDYSKGLNDTVNLWLWARTQSGEIRMVARVTDAAGTTSIEAGSSIPIQLGKFYTVAVRYGGTPGAEELQIRIFGEEGWQTSGGTLSGGVYQPASANTDIHVHIGSLGRDVTQLDDGVTESRMVRCSAADIHRFRIWDDPDHDLEPDNTETPLVDYRMVERGSTLFSDSLGNGPDARLIEVGQNAFSTGADKVPHRPNALWTDPLVLNASLKFDGYSHFLTVPGSVRYRKSVPDIWDLEEDDELLTYAEMSSYSIVMIVKFDQIRNCTFAHYAPVRTTAASADVDDANPDYYWALNLEVNGGDFRIGFGVGTSSTTASQIFTDVANITINTTDNFLILASRDSVAGTMSLRVTTTSASWEEEVEDNSAATTVNDDVAGNKNDFRSSKYCLVLGSGIEKARFNTRQNEADDPNDYQLRLNYLRMFKGVIGAFGVIATERTTGGSGQIPKEVVLSLLDKNYTKEVITSLSPQFRVKSLWFFDEGSGSSANDSGLLGNHITFIEDPARRYIRNQSGYTIEQATPPSIDAISEVFSEYRGRKLVAIGGSAAYEVDTTSNALTPIGDGFRNDDSNKVFLLPYRRDLLMTAGNKPYRLRDDDIFPVGVEVLDSSKIRFGLIQQGYEAGKLQEGLYRYRFVYFSQITQEEGDYSAEISVRIPADSNANVAFGATSTDEATADTLSPQISVNQRSAVIDSPSDGPFDLTDGNSAWSGAVMTVIVRGGGPEGLGNVHQQDLVIVRADVRDPKNVPARELAQVFESKLEKIRARAVNGGLNLRVLSSYVGEYDAPTGARLTFDNVALTGDQTDLYAILGFTTDNFNADGSDGGISTQPLPMPLESPQVTHIRIYRTAADGDVFRFLDEIVIGDAPDGYTGGRYFIDGLEDDDLAFQRPMLDQSGVMPKCTMIAELGGFIFYAGNEDHPERLYFAQGEPHRVSPINFVDILEGRTRDITGLQRYAGGILIFKEHATFTLTFTSSPVLPFRIEMRKPDVGCLGRFGVANVRDSLYVADPQYPRRYDSLNYADVGYPVHKTWGNIDEVNARDVFAIHWRSDMRVLFADDTSDQVFSFDIRKGAWSKWSGVCIRVGEVVEEGGRLDRVAFGDRYGNVFQFDPAVFSDGTNWVTDATKINESVTGTGFTIAGTTLTLTDWASIDADDSALVRGMRVYLNDGTNEDEKAIIYSTAAGTLILETASTTISDNTYAEGTWSVGRIDAEFRSGDIRADADESIHVKKYIMDMERPAGWPTGHNITLTGYTRSGVVTPGEFTKTIIAESQDDFWVFFPFQGRAVRWGVRNQNPEEPFSVSHMSLDVDLKVRARPF